MNKLLDGVGEIFGGRMKLAVYKFDSLQILTFIPHLSVYVLSHEVSLVLSLFLFFKRSLKTETFFRHLYKKVN